MSHMVRLLPMDISFVVREGETVLDAALNNNIAFPNRCQMGSCAMCHVPCACAEKSLERFVIK